MDALSLLKKDHQTVEALFKQFEQLGDRAVKARKKVVEKIILELSIHASVEETVFYPAVRATAKKVDAGEADDEILEALEEHHIVKWTLSELEKMSAGDERFEAKVTVLIESVRHHVKEEEQELFKSVRKLFAPEELKALGLAMAKAKLVAPTHPHPRAPDQPPGNIVVGAVSAAFDRGMDAVKQVASRVRGKRDRQAEQSVH